MVSLASMVRRVASRPQTHPAEIVRRTEWLREHHPVGRYHLIGWNCEHAANFCINEYTESLQIRRLFFVHAWTLIVPITSPSRTGGATLRG